MELAGYLAIVRRWWTTLLIATWVAGLAGFLIASGVPPTYEGHARLLVGPVIGDLDVTRAAGTLTYTYAELATNGPAVDGVRESLGLPDDTDIFARTIANETTRFLEIRAEHGDPEIAAAIANALAEQLVTTQSSGVVLPEGQLSIVEPAMVNPDPIAPQVTLIAIIAAGLGLLGAVVLVLLVEYFGNTVNSSRELADLTPFPFHGTAAIGRRFRPSPNAPTILDVRPRSRGAAAIRTLATKLAYASPDSITSSALIVGTAPHDGSADLALGLATVLARTGRTVLLIDADEETGELSQLLGIDGVPGLAEVLENPELPTGDIVVNRRRGPAVISRGRSSRLEILDPTAAKGLVDRLTKEYEIVLTVASPAHVSGSALVWARSTERVLVVVERDRASRDDVVYAIDSLAAVGASVTGTVLIEQAPRPLKARPKTRPLPVTDAEGASPARPPLQERSPAPRRSDGLGH